MLSTLKRAASSRLPRPSKRSRRRIYENEAGSDTGASGGSASDSSDSEWHGISHETEDWSDLQHFPFDTSKVLANIADDFPENPADPNSWRPLQLRGLLMGFVQGSMGILNPKYSQYEVAGELLRTHPELQDLLVTAWDQRQYDRVLTLELLRAESTSGLTHSSSGLSDGQKEELLFAFNEPYQGIAADAFYEYLYRSHHYYLDEDRHQYYAKFCSIVQSSGTGKTRAISELSRKGVLLLYINLRPAADDSGFPERDYMPASILTGDCKSKEQYFIECCAFFSAIFKLIREDLLCRLECNKVKGAAIENWNEDMQLGTSTREQFFKRLHSTYEKIRNKFQLDADKMSDRSNTNLRRADVELKVHYYKKLTEVLESAFPNADRHHPKLVIALDEAHPLHEKAKFRRSTILFRVIKAYSAPRSPHAVWVVFASTTSKVADFATPQTLFDSARVSVGGELVFPPFCQLGWDQYAPALGTVPPTEVAKAKHILRYGRPLWVSLTHISLPDEIFTLAVSKLIGKTPYNGSNDQHALVVLSQRFGLDISFGHREAVRFVDSTVASHMRVTVTTTEDRLWSYTTYPSEPILSCAAAHSMHRGENSLTATLHTLKRKMDNGMIDIGQCGELVSRLIWLLAKDFLVIRNQGTAAESIIGSGDNMELVHCQMVPVIEFIEFVFGKDFWEEVKDGAGSAAKKAFQGAYINFSHWVSMKSYIRQDKSKDQLDLNKWTMRHWQRTCAVQCCQNQPDIDKVIPIFFKSARSGPEGVDCVSQILISDKARTSKQYNALNKIQRNDPTIGGQEHPNPLPYIAIVADLRLEETGLESVTFATRTSPRMTNDPQCLRIRACGLGEKSYPFFKPYPKVLKALKSLLDRETTPPKSERLLNEHLQSRVRYGDSGEAQHMEWEQSIPHESNWRKRARLL